MTYVEFMIKFGSEEKIINHYIKVRYNNSVTCRHCGSAHVSHRTDQPKLFNCLDCKNTFSIFYGTILQNTRTKLQTWFFIMYMELSAKKGLSGLNIQRLTGLTYKCVWDKLYKIRKAMGNSEREQFKNAVVEMDETYVGGKPRKKNNKKSTGSKRGRGTKKIPVIGIISRSDKRIYAEVSTKNKQGERLSGNQLLKVLEKVCRNKKENTIITDEFRGYNKLKKKKYTHKRIDHKKMFVDGEIHTNNIESFWAIIKRAVYGTYHHISAKHLQKYIDSFCFRYNNKNNLFDSLLKQTIAA